MKYIGVLKDNIIVNSLIRYENVEIYDNEIELSEEQYNSIIVPCKLIKGEFISCEYPPDEIIPSQPIMPTEIEKISADVDLIKLEMGLF